jgi:hypothetical protein
MEDEYSVARGEKEKEKNLSSDWKTGWSEQLLESNDGLLEIIATSQAY